MKSLVALLAVSALVGFAPPAAAQSNPFGPLPPAPQDPPPVPAPPRQADEQGLAKWQQALILVAALVVLGGIAWAIVRDARQAAPADARSRPQDERAKAARRQRKRNRAR